MLFSTSALLLSLLCRSVKEYNTAEEEASHFEVLGLFRSIGSFIGIFLGSFLLGCTMALLTALVSSSSKDIPLSKWRNNYKNNAVSSSSSDSDHNKCVICWVVVWVSHAVRSHFTASTTHIHTHTHTHTHYSFSYLLRLSSTYESFLCPTWAALTFHLGMQIRVQWSHQLKLCSLY